ncbi:hypothetical protein DFA_04440 [Cavenderia fasciculata]|uniref:EGF-like domain-containing protein n=1 Tax=Cavenderia fasciculata TaxID=261658 RepID=F4PPK9_CACFS|nr:uncharacterized protein DFA_04440 [Cavenderia fasciculata]EGG22322.1 hypothetical protein DFA_04440 [Cavenderia fasciculata]|eukprot:XP_004360173.1 hypothetical protein DFA_04440 [Cavenderia fasciculata]
MSVQELNSAIWIIRQYGSTIQENEAAICSSGYFTCSPTNDHIIKINLDGYPTTTTGALPPLQTEFVFPELVELRIRVEMLKTPSFNILDYIGTSVALKVIDIINDGSVTRIPTAFIVTSSFTEFPLSVYPDTLESIKSRNGDLTTFPNVPQSVSSYEFPNNKLQGAIPWNIFQNTNNILFDISNNPLITSTSVPQSFCSNKLRIRGCPSITSVPDCFLCYRLNTIAVQIDIIPDPDFQCNIVLDSTMIYTVKGSGNITGENIGYGNNVDNRYLLRPLISNKHLSFFDGLREVGPPRTVALTLDSMYPSYTYNFTVVEVAIEMESLLYRQLPTGVVQFRAFVYNFNAYIPHTFKINGRVDSFYPSNETLVSWDNIIKVGSNYSFTGYFGLGSGRSVAVYFNGDPSICTVFNISSGVVECNQTKYWSGIGLTNITINVNGFWSTPIFANLSSLESLCNTTGCSGHGICDQYGVCVCDTGYYSDKCLGKYPTFASGSYDLNNRKLISIYGDFGPYNQTIVSIKLNDTDCQVTSKSQSLINCTLVSDPSDGLALVRLTVDNSTNNGNNWIYFHHRSSGSGSDSNELTCPFNCYGHGQCINGKCKCDTDIFH